MATSVRTNETNPSLQLKEQTPHQLVSHDIGSSAPIAVQNTNKRRCVTSVDALQKTETGAREEGVIRTYTLDPCEEKRQMPTEEVGREVEEEGGREEGSVYGEMVTNIAVIAAKNEQLQASVASLKRKFSLREDHTHQLLLGLGALKAVTNELALLHKDYQERSVKNAALVQELLVQIANCSAQVDMLKKSRGLKVQQLHKFKQECAQELNRLIARLGDLAESACQEPNLEEEKNDDGLSTAASMRENLQQVEPLKEEVCEHMAAVIDDRSVKSSGGRSQQETTDRINLTLLQLDNLHADMFQLKQTLVQENQSFRRHLEDHLSRQIAHTRELQDNERERIYEEVDEIRSGMCGILRDIHRLKERTKYLVPSMAQSSSRPLEIMGKSSEDRWMSIHTPTSATPMPYKRSYDWEMPSQMEGHQAHPYHPHNTKSGNSSPARSGDKNWRMFTPKDVPVTDQPVPQLCESPHYSSRSSSLSGRLSNYGEENGKPTAEQFDRQLLEQHRLFWIGEGAG
ncbi:unnamed protein product [Peronospora farinosa]|uniref:Uncharacterized protein n=1 Tax=Peronospora farinosa TaxID=134698 RepID=A0ABN8CCB9_9STRA|nr:unnamed protein product [Peronospora farinosa]